MDGRGVPLSLIVTGAHRHDVTQLDAVLRAIVADRPPAKGRQHLCADAGYVGMPARLIMIEHDYVPHVRSRRDEGKPQPNGRPTKPRRWVVEVCHSWYNRFRKLLVRYEKKSANYLALLYLASAIICWRKVVVIYG